MMPFLQSHKIYKTRLLPFLPFFHHFRHQEIFSILFINYVTLNKTHILMILSLIKKWQVPPLIGRHVLDTDVWYWAG